MKVLEEKAGFKCEYQDYDFGGDRYLKTGEVLPDIPASEAEQGDDA